MDGFGPARPREIPIYPDRRRHDLISGTYPASHSEKRKDVGVGHGKQLNDVVLGQCPRACDGSWPVTRPINLIAGHMR